MFLNTEGWWITPNQQVLPTAKVTEVLLKKLHEETCMGGGAVIGSVEGYALGPELQRRADIIVKRCQTCANAPKIQKKAPAGEGKRGRAPGERRQMDFTELPKRGQYKELVGLVDAFSGWLEASPCHTNRGTAVVEALLKEIIPRFGIPEGL